MSRLQLIEKKLLAINSATFQNLCDTFLFLRENKFQSFNRTGSQLGKEKTVQGTPDTFFRLPSGALRYVEHTTQADGLVKKIKDDIEKCLDEKKTGVPADEINEVIICFNGRLSPDQEGAVQVYAREKKIHLELLGIDLLALAICSKYVILAKEYLDIPLDTGQILPLSIFIDEYGSKAGMIAAPLDNHFCHRLDELSEIESILSSIDILVISGFPGVGKSKLALEVMKKFLEKNQSFEAFAIANKTVDISDDLRIHLDQEKDFILLVDDANRQMPNFKQILGVFREIRKGRIKLIITVRDYALEGVRTECQEFLPKIFELKKFNEKEIKELVESNPFEIRNSKYQDKIVEVADGNARLAVMAARLANVKQFDFLQGDVSDLYDSYFSTFTKDSDISTNIILLKTLGIVSFFHTIDRGDRKLMDQIITTFNLDYHQFQDTIDELERRELIEVRHNVAKVSEQVMATYFFDKVFLKDEILSFRNLLFTFFHKWRSKFTDSVVPASIAFGYKGVLEKLKVDLTDYLESIRSKDEAILDFLQIFWLFLMEETLAYFHGKIKEIPEPETPVYQTDYATNDFVIGGRDKTLDFLSEFFRYETENLIPALQLAFEYARKKPSLLPQLVRRIREQLIFDEDDAPYGFSRQRKLFAFLIEKISGPSSPFLEAFFALSYTFLAYGHRNSRGGRNHSINIYSFFVPPTTEIFEFRSLAWTTLFRLFDEYPDEVFKAINGITSGIHSPDLKILEFDLGLLLPFFQKQLDETNISHIHFVRTFFVWLQLKPMQKNKYKDILVRFSSKEYELVRKLDWNIYRGRQDYEFDNVEKFQSLKRKELENSFTFDSVDQFEVLHSTIQNLRMLKIAESGKLTEALNIILLSNFEKNPDLGFSLLESILTNLPTDIFVMGRALLKVISFSEAYALSLWNFLEGWENPNSLYWKLAFFDILPAEFVSDEYHQQFLSTIISLNQPCFLNLDGAIKFLEIHEVNSPNENIICEVVRIVNEKIEKEKIAIQLPHDFFQKYAHYLSLDLGLLSTTYLLQEGTDEQFDHDRSDLQTVIAMNQNFLYEYLTKTYSKHEGRQRTPEHDNFSFVWRMANHFSIVEDVANMIADSNLYMGIGEYPLIILFNHLDAEQVEEARKFLLYYVGKYHDNRAKVNAVFDVIRHRLPSLFETAFLHYLSFNTNFEDFQNIHWRGNSWSWSGDTIIGEVEAEEWREMLSMLSKVPNQLDLIPIRSYLKKRVEWGLRSAEQERKKRFVDPHY